MHRPPITDLQHVLAEMPYRSLVYADEHPWGRQAHVACSDVTGASVLVVLSLFDDAHCALLKSGKYANISNGVLYNGCKMSCFIVSLHPVSGRWKNATHIVGFCTLFCVVVEK